MEAIDLNDDVMDEGTQQLEVIENSEANRGTQPRQRRKVSRLWRKFTIMGPKQSDGKTKIRCNFCKRFYFLKLRKNGTSTPTRHMKVCPKAVGTPRSTSRKVEITDLISGSSYPTSNLYFNEIWKIECWLRAHANHSDRVICEMVESMKLKFDKYWEEYSDILAIAAVLDPRLKFEILEYCFSVLDQSTCKRRLANVRSKIYRLFGAYKKSQRISSTATTSQGETPDVPAGYGGFYTFFSQKAVGSGKSAPDIYLDEPLLDYAAHKKLNVLHYWRDNSARFKELATMAREVLSIPITTVASESSFSIGSRVLNKYRSCLLPTNVQALVCTRNWLKGFPEMGDECVEKTEEEKEEEVKQEENEEESGQSIDLT